MAKVTNMVAAIFWFILGGLANAFVMPWLLDLVGAAGLGTAMTVTLYSFLGMWIVYSMIIAPYQLATEESAP